MGLPSASASRPEGDWTTGRCQANNYSASGAQLEVHRIFPFKIALLTTGTERCFAFGDKTSACASFISILGRQHKARVQVSSNKSVGAKRAGQLVALTMASAVDAPESIGTTATFRPSPAVDLRAMSEDRGRHSRSRFETRARLLVDP